MESEMQYRVAGADDVSISPRGNRVMLWFDDDSGVDLSGLHVVTLEREKPRKAKAT